MLECIVLLVALAFMFIPEKGWLGSLFVVWAGGMFVADHRGAGGAVMILLMVFGWVPALFYIGILYWVRCGVMKVVERLRVAEKHDDPDPEG